MTTIEALPDEVLEFLFSKLELKDRKNVRLVNKLWLELSNSARITRREFMKINNGRLRHFNIPKGHLNLFIRVVNDEDVQDVPFEEEGGFWLKHGHSLRTLEVCYYDVFNRILSKTMNYCPNLTQLVLTFVFGDYNIDYGDIVERENAKLDCLETLKLKAVPATFLYGDQFVRLSNIVPNLKSLELNYVTLKDSKEKSHLFSIIVKQAFILTKLVFKSCNFATNEFLEFILETLGPQLSSLRLIRLPLNNIDCFHKHREKLSNLKNLELSYIKNLRNSPLSGLLGLENIQFLSFIETTFSTEDFTALASLKNLKGLDISGTRCTVGQIKTLFGSNVLTNMIALRMAYLDFGTDEILAAILPNLPNLKLLDLASWNISSMGVQTVLTSCKQLTHLSFLNCQNIKDVTKPISINSLENLKYLNLSWCIRLDRANIPKLCFGKLEELGLKGISLTKEMFEGLLKNCPKLKRGNFEYLKEL